jgi:hypothetical protein
MKSLKEQLNQLEQLIDKATIEAPTVSKQPIGWHVEHALKIIVGICKQLQQADPQQYKKPTFNLAKEVIITTGKIPRGLGRAPKHTLPEGAPDAERLRKLHKTAIEEVSTIPQQHELAYFQHPLWGHFKRDKVERFLRIHTNHHLKIADDILKKAQ